MTNAEIKDALRKYFQVTSNYSPPDEEDLFDAGLLDSFGVVDFLTFLEEEMKVTIDLEDITAENFSTLNRISTLIEKMEKNP